MQELIKVTEENGEQLVSARDLHEFLEIKSRFNDWIKNRIEKYDFEENQDFVTITKKLVTAQGNESNYLDYILKIDMAKELSMVENNDKGSQARKYFIQCENKLKQVTKKQLPENYLEALKQLVISEEKRIEAEKTNAILMHVNKNYTSTEIRDLRELYLKYNADERILEGFEMLVSNRIYEHEDYFNNRVATPSGILQDKHLQLIVTSGFNIIDQINKVPEYKERLRILNESITNEEATYLKYESDHYMQIFIYGILMIKDN